MQRYDLTLSSKIALLYKIESQPLNTSYRRLTKITSVKNPDAEEALDQCISIVSGKGVNINDPILKAKAEAISKQLMVDYRDGKPNTNINFKKRMVKIAVLTTKVSNNGELTRFLLLDKFCADDIKC
ncbi:hypothetical protein RF11_12092 [Thelohanellus kitauei]|uniref:Uncharacterized protein n=1 Tax=Thelohanellus kitauei TaxID=669202 RepID=A0A0C2MQE8_THEKT|nr:hypothetical protein RF11_12092 [Thelohanellus kitauei]